MMNTKLKKLAETRNKLKSDFVGLDSIIDRVLDSITPWYLTPEVLERPTVVSLWGLTGTGKTSLIRKLVNYLGISEKSLFFDCGEQGGENDSKLFSEKLDDLFESSRLQENDPRYSKENFEKLGIKLDNGSTPKTDPFDYTFVFDEFQYLRTKDPSGGEESRPEGRAIWTLMDSGMVDINRCHYRMKALVDYLEDLEFFSDKHPGIQIENGKFDKSLGPLLKQQLSYYRWSEEEDNDDGGINLLNNEDFSFLIKKLNILQKGLGFEVAEKMKRLSTLTSFIDYIRDFIKLITLPKIINCSRSLVFILGNLDEAFELTGEDMDPDIDADVYHEMTSKVNCMDIKLALRQRFRDEQIGRLGNNIIIYPSLRRQDFIEIIERETSRIAEKFKDSYGIYPKISQKLRDLIYSEGCFPIQGVRPLFSTINSLISPLLSLILTSKTKEKGEVLLDVLEDNFNVSQVTLVVNSAEEKWIGEKKVNLNLGPLRSLDHCKKIGLQAIHEASHAVLYHLLTSKYPSAIIASNVFGDGGYMMNAIEVDSSTDNIKDLKNEIIVSLAGYYGEHHFFDFDHCSLGSSSDLSEVWQKLRMAFYNSGIHVPMYFSERYVSTSNEGVPFGFPVEEKEEINRGLWEFFNARCEETKYLISQEEKVIKEIAKYLVDNRSMGIDIFKKYIENYGSDAFKSEKTNTNYYINILYGKETAGKNKG